MKNIAIIPVRAGSTRVKKKNLLDFFGKPMFVHTVHHAMNSKVFEKIVVSTESEEVLDICNQYSIDTDYVRPDILSGGDVSLDDVCCDVLKFYKDKNIVFDNMCLLWATSPMRDDIDIVNSLNILKENYKNTDAVVAVTEYYYPPYCATIQDKNKMLQPIMPLEFWKGSHGWPKTYVDCGSISWVKMESFEKDKTWFPNNTRPYYLPKSKAVDLDTYEDLELLTLYYRHQNKIDL